METTFRLPSGASVGPLGQGAWMIGEDRRRRAAERRALEVGLDLGLTLIDTAEMYGDGSSEELVAEARSFRASLGFTATPQEIERYKRAGRR